MDNAGDLEDDLFGSDDGGEKVRELADRELNSGDDGNRDDREPAKPESEDIEYISDRETRYLSSTVWRHPLPNPADGEVCSQRPLRMSFSYLNSSTPCAYPSS